MFETHKTAEVHVPHSIADEDKRLWGYVALKIQIPWFYVVYKVLNPAAFESTGVLFLNNLEQLISLQQDQDINILQIDLVSPGYMNGTGQWKMEPLSEILEGLRTDTDIEQWERVFVLRNGVQYFETCAMTENPTLTKMTLLFKV